MSLQSYPELARHIREKRRGRPHEVMVNVIPELWAKFSTDITNTDVHKPINIWFKDAFRPVARLMPDNSMTITIGQWPTPISCKIVEALSGVRACMHRNHVWVGSQPVDGGVVSFDADRRIVYPEKLVAVEAKAKELLAQITLDDLPAKHRMMYELGTWKPSGAITQTVKDYAGGKVGKDQLSPRDIMTIASGWSQVSIISRLFVEAL